MNGIAIRCLFVVSALCLASSLAQAADSSGSTTTTTEMKVNRGLLKDERYSIKPLVGAMAYTDAQGNSTSRMALGVTMDMNALTIFGKGLTQWYAGPAIGVIASHMGDPTSNFFGKNPTNNFNQANANNLIMPANIKAGYAFTDYCRIGVHGGGNVIYRSVANSINLGSGSDTSSSLWKFYPNLGADLDIALSKKVALSLRPDLTLAPGNNLFIGSLGIGIFLG